MGNHNPCNATDKMLVAYLISKGAGTAADVWSAKRSGDKDIQPATVCWAHNARVQRSGPFTGLWLVEAFIEVRSNALPEENEIEDDPKRKAVDRLSTTLDAFLEGVDSSAEKLGLAITAAGRGDPDVGQATIQSVEIVQIDQGFNSRATTTSPTLLNTWLDTIHLEILWCPQNITS